MKKIVTFLSVFLLMISCSDNKHEFSYEQLSIKFEQCALVLTGGKVGSPDNWVDLSKYDGYHVPDYILQKNGVALECHRGGSVCLLPYHEEIEWSFDTIHGVIQFGTSPQNKWEIVEYDKNAITLVCKNGDIPCQYREYALDYDRNAQLERYKMTYEEAKAASDEYAKEWEENHPQPVL